MQEELDKRLSKRNMIIFGIILLGSIVWFWLTLSKTNKDVKRVRSWIKAPCLIKCSVIVKDNTMAEPWLAVHAWAIYYTYEYNGCEYTSSRYNIVEKNKAMDRQEQEVVDRTPYGIEPKVHKPFSAGEKSICFVNSENPDESVLVCEVGNKAIIERLFLPGFAIATSLILLLYTLLRHWYLFR